MSVTDWRDDAWIEWLEVHIDSPMRVWMTGGFLDARAAFVAALEDAHRRGWLEATRDGLEALDALLDVFPREEEGDERPV